MTEISEILFKRTNETILSNIKTIIESHEPGDIMEGICDYCSMNEIELDDVIKLIKRSSDIKQVLETQLTLVKAISHDPV